MLRECIALAERNREKWARSAVVAGLRNRTFGVCCQRATRGEERTRGRALAATTWAPLALPALRGGASLGAVRRRVSGSHAAPARTRLLLDLRGRVAVSCSAVAKGVLAGCGRLGTSRLACRATATGGALGCWVGAGRGTISDGGGAESGEVRALDWRRWLGGLVRELHASWEGTA